jgi:hypothetical protein
MLQWALSLALGEKGRPGCWLAGWLALFRRHSWAGSTCVMSDEDDDNDEQRR